MDVSPEHLRTSGPRRQGNRKRSWYEQLARSTEFLEADFVDFHYPRHVHETFAIGVIERGAQRFATGSGETVMPAATVCVVDPGVVHWGWPATEAGWRYRMFYPSLDVVAAALDVAPSRVAQLGFGEAVIDDRDLFDRFALLHRRAAAGDGFGLDDTVGTFLADLFARHAPDARSLDDSASTTAALLVREYLHDHAATAVRLADLADVTGVSEAHVSRTFRRHYGMSPYAYLLALRVERSKAVLVAGRPISEVATTFGFHDQPHFHRTFRRIVGVTPGAFQRLAV